MRLSGRAFPAALIALLALGASAAGGRPPAIGALDQAKAGAVSFEQVEPGTNISFCQGVTMGNHVATVNHCIVQTLARLRSGKRVVMRLQDGSLTALDADALIKQSGKPLAASIASTGLDFYVLPDVRTGDPRDGSDLLAASSAVSIGNPVTVMAGKSGPKQCQVTQVCGSEVTYRCPTNLIEGDSGSGVWLETAAGPRLVGLHKRGSAAVTLWGTATSIRTVLARSSRLFSNKEDFAHAIARRPEFAYDWSSARCIRTVSHAFSAITPLATRPVIHGMAMAGDDTLVTANTWTGELCVSSAAKAKPRRCTLIPGDSKSRINAVVPLGDNLFGLPEASPDNGPTASMSFLKLDADFSPAFDPPEAPRTMGKVGSMRTAIRVGGDIIVGADNGLCVVTGSECTPLCPPDEKMCRNPFRINGLVAVTPTDFLAVGRDYDVNNVPFPNCAWFHKDAEGWDWVSGCELGPMLRDTNAAMRSGGRDFQFKAPVLIGKDVVVFGSDGGAYALVPQRRPVPVPISGLDDERGQVEDSVRDAVVLSESPGSGAGAKTYIATASSDGAVRILRVEGSGASLKLIADSELTVFDVGIWATELSHGPSWLAARSQDGKVTIIRWKKLPL